MLRQSVPPAARFLSRERNRGKSAAGLRPCTPVRRALKRRGHRRGGEEAGAGRESAVSDGAPGKAEWLFRVLICTVHRSRRAAASLAGGNIINLRNVPRPS